MKRICTVDIHSSNNAAQLENAKGKIIELQEEITKLKQQLEKTRT
jgi:hypothetical protein